MKIIKKKMLKKKINDYENSIEDDSKNKRRNCI